MDWTDNARDKDRVTQDRTQAKAQAQAQGRTGMQLSANLGKSSKNKVLSLGPVQTPAHTRCIAT